MLIGPATISRFIAPFSFDTIQSKANWAFAHICEEVHKVVPSIMDFNARAAVPAIILFILVVTTLHHPAPLLVGQAGVSTTVTMDTVVCTASLFLKTAARLSAAVAKFVSRDRLHISAIATTQPASLSREVLCVNRFNYESSESSVNHGSTIA